MTLYFDHNASTPVDPRVIEFMQPLYAQAFANPGSSHAAGREARKILEHARESIGKIIDCDPTEIIFTSGGTESANLALHGLSHAAMSQQNQLGNNKNVILAMPGQHPSTRETLKILTHQKRLQLVDIPLTPDGQLDETKIADLPWDQTILISTIHGHNETGVISKLDTIRKQCAEFQIPWFVDGVQSIGRLAISVRNIAASALSFGAHKFGGPRGIGGLVLKNGTPFTPFMTGGFQESGKRPGTENPILAAGMAKALELWWKERQFRYSHLLALRNRFEEGLHNLANETSLKFKITAEDLERLPNTTNVTFYGHDGEALLVSLDLQGVCCSMGSACASGSPEPAPVLLAMGYSKEDARSTLRFTFGTTNTPEEIDQLLKILRNVLK